MEDTNSAYTNPNTKADAKAHQTTTKAVTNPTIPSTAHPTQLLQLHQKELLPRNEKAIADGGYNDAKSFKICDVFGEEISSIIRDRHDTANRRLKRLKSDGGVVRHRVHKHGLIVHTVKRICQMELALESNLFSLNW